MKSYTQWFSIRLYIFYTISIDYALASDLEWGVNEENFSTENWKSTLWRKTTILTLPLKLFVIRIVYKSLFYYIHLIRMHSFCDSKNVLHFFLMYRVCCHYTKSVEPRKASIHFQCALWNCKQNRINIFIHPVYRHRTAPTIRNPISSRFRFGNVRAS